MCCKLSGMVCSEVKEQEFKTNGKSTKFYKFSVLVDFGQFSRIEQITAYEPPKISRGESYEFEVVPSARQYKGSAFLGYSLLGLGEKRGF